MRAKEGTFLFISSFKVGVPFISKPAKRISPVSLEEKI